MGLGRGYEDAWVDVETKRPDGRPCPQGQAEIEACVEEEADKNKHPFTGSYSCGDWAADVLRACCLDPDVVPSTSLSKQVEISPCACRVVRRLGSRRRI